MHPASCLLAASMWVLQQAHATPDGSVAAPKSTEVCGTDEHDAGECAAPDEHGFVDLSGDNGVRKKVLRPSGGRLVPVHGAKLSVFYTGRLSDRDGEVFDGGYSDDQVAACAVIACARPVREVPDVRGYAGAAVQVPARIWPGDRRLGPRPAEHAGG